MLMLSVNVKILCCHLLVLFYVVMKTKLVSRLSRVVFQIALSLWHVA